MQQLWEPIEQYICYNSKEHHINDTCGRFFEFIPYVRKYKNLTIEELLNLIKDAKTNHWQALDLTCCGLETLPDELWELSELKMLYLGNRAHRIGRETDFIGTDNSFSTLPRKIEMLRNLEVLSLCRNPLHIEGDTVLNLERLIHLDIFHCKFLQVPEALLIPSIQEIGFDCQERELSDNFIKLKKLRTVYFSNAKITTLPENFGELVCLEKLWLHGTKISSLPNSISEARSLSFLEIGGTPLEDTLPPEILKQSAKEVINYVLAQQSNAPKQYFNESKMIIVGQGQVGKTSILNRLVNESFFKNFSTEGIEIKPWLFDFKKESYKLNVWDFGGQEIYHSTHQFFLTKRSLYLVVWDALAEDEYGRIDYWLKTIQSFANDSPIIIVVNKCDKGIGRIKRIDAEDYRERFPQIKDIVYVSCKDNIKISYLRNLVKQIAIKLPLMKTSWLSTWMSVRQKLEILSKSKNFISYREYLEICKSQNIDAEEAKSIIKYLHDLGIVLYYHDDLLLKNLVILSSEWGTDAVYKVLDEQERRLKGKNGILKIDELSDIWKDEKCYPPELYPHLLNLMERFQLAFKISDDSYLIAELLDDKVIVLERDFFPEESLFFRYEYDFLPAGVMTRFIVAINPYLETVNGVKQCWKRGAYLKYESAYALVRLYDNIQERYVQISVSGENFRHRQELLSKIRTVFEEINKQFSQIKITERIPCNCSTECDFLFDYKTLLKAERMGKVTVECHHSLANVEIKKLLDGVEIHMNSDYGKVNVIFNNNPHYENTTTVSAASASVNSVIVTAEIKSWINGLQGDLNDLKDEVGDHSGDFNVQVDKVKNALEKLEQSNTQDEMQKTGAMNKIYRFLLECTNPESKTGKLLAGIKYSADIVKNLIGKYNKLAKWTMLPQIPFGDN